MRIDALSIEDLPQGPLHRMEASFEALNARIARLAISLGVALDHEEHVHDLLKSPGFFVFESDFFLGDSTSTHLSIS